MQNPHAGFLAEDISPILELLRLIGSCDPIAFATLRPRVDLVRPRVDETMWSEMTFSCSHNDTSDVIGAFLHGHIFGGNVAHCDLGPVPCIGHVENVYSRYRFLEQASALQDGLTIGRHP